MSNIDDKLVLDDTREAYCDDDNQSTEIKFGLLSLALSPPDDCSLREEERNYQVSDSSSQQKTTSISSDELEYRIHLGTQPGDNTKGQITFIQSQGFHSRIIDYVETFLITSKVNYKLIRKNSFSISKWGFEPYACLVLYCSHEMATGIAAIIGLALRQDAIGIFTANSNDSPHSVFTVKTSDGSLISKTKAITLIKIVTKDHKGLSAQFDKDGQHIEFHDYENSNDEHISTHRIQRTIDRNLGTNHLFQLTKSSSHSSLLKQKDYEKAIEQAGLQPFSKLIELTRLHDQYYNTSESP